MLSKQTDTPELSFDEYAKRTKVNLKPKKSLKNSEVGKDQPKEFHQKNQ
jgi:hypothetical protein